MSAVTGIRCFEYRDIAAAVCRLIVIALFESGVLCRRAPACVIGPCQNAVSICVNASNKTRMNRVVIIYILVPAKDQPTKSPKYSEINVKGRKADNTVKNTSICL